MQLIRSRQTYLPDMLPLNTRGILDVHWVQKLLAERNAINLGNSGGQGERKAKEEFQSIKKGLVYPWGVKFLTFQN